MPSVMAVQVWEAWKDSLIEVPSHFLKMAQVDFHASHAHKGTQGPE